MAQRPGAFSEIKPAGRYERPKGLPRATQVACERVELSLAPTEELWWDRAGVLYADRDLTQPVGLTIVRLA
jgi:hypothetical protein